MDTWAMVTARFGLNLIKLKKTLYKIDALRHFISRRVSLFLVLGLIAAAAVVSIFAAEPILLAQSNDRTLTIDETLTIGDITVELSESVKTADGLDIGYTYRPSKADMVVHPIGVPEIRSSETAVGARKGVVNSRNNFTASFPWNPGKSGYNETADISLGSFVVSKPDIFGSARIELGTDYASGIPASEQSASVSLDTDLHVGERHYRITDMTLLRDTESAGFSTFKLTLHPVNDSAGNTEIASGGKASVVLTDDAGNTYQWLGTRTHWSKSRNSRNVAWQQLTFEGTLPPSVSTLSLDITGGGNVAGPFVFEDVRVVPVDGR